MLIGVKILFLRGKTKESTRHRYTDDSLRLFFLIFFWEKEKNYTFVHMIANHKK